MVSYHRCLLLNSPSSIHKGVLTVLNSSTGYVSVYIVYGFARTCVLITVKPLFCDHTPPTRTAWGYGVLLILKLRRNFTSSFNIYLNASVCFYLDHLSRFRPGASCLTEAFLGSIGSQDDTIVSPSTVLTPSVPDLPEAGHNLNTHNHRRTAAARLRHSCYRCFTITGTLRPTHAT